MNQSDITKILESHKAWLNSEESGERADLRNADLWGADLRGTDLWDANLWGANLRGAIDAPAQLQAGPWSVCIHGGYIRIGCERHTIEEWRNFSDAEIAGMDDHALEWWKHWKPAIMALAEAQQSYYAEEAK